MRLTSYLVFPLALGGAMCAGRLASADSVAGVTDVKELSLADLLDTKIDAAARLLPAYAPPSRPPVPLNRT